MNTGEILTKLQGVKKTASGWQAKCPAHEDKTPSLAITATPDGKTLLKCFAGCDTTAICEAISITTADLFAEKRQSKPKISKTETYLYQDLAGTLIGKKTRYDFDDGSKTFKWAELDKSKPLPLYGSECLATAKDIILLVEGERKRDQLQALGYTALSVPAGAGAAFRAEWTEALKGRDIVLLPDNDQPGQKALATWSAALLPVCKSLRTAKVSADHNDIVDLFKAVGASEEARLDALQEILLDAQEVRTVTPPTATETKVQSVDEIRSKLWALTQEKLSATELCRLSAAAVVEWLHDLGHFYHHGERRDFSSVMFFDGARKLLLPVQGDDFRGWLSDALAINRSERVFQFVQSAVETEGLSARSTGIDPCAFWAARDASCYLSNGPGCMAKISGGKVAIVDNGTDGILFPASATLPAWRLCEPVNPFETCSIFRDMSTAAGHGRELFKIWSVLLPTDQRTKPPLCAAGTVGSGKTRLIRGVFELYGLPERISAIHKSGEGDFWAALDGGGLCCWDNADTRIDWLPDALAAAATAGTLEKRRLYTDADRISLKARAWVSITTANPTFAADAGLADRLIVIRLNRREGTTAESKLSDEIKAARDAGLSWICQTLAVAISENGSVPAGLNARHPDWASLAVRVGRACGREQQTIAALKAAEQDKGLFNLENDSVGAAILELVANKPFYGTAAELLEAIKAIDTSFEGRMTTRRLVKRIQKLWPHLQATLKAECETGHAGFMHWTFQTPASGDAGDSGEAFSVKSYTRENIRTLPETVPPQSPQSDKDLFDYAEEAN